MVENLADISGASTLEPRHHRTLVDTLKTDLATSPPAE
jgi:hypothetical protein